MPWNERQQKAAYTPPASEDPRLRFPEERIEFEYENVSRQTEKRTTAFSFPGINDNYVQDNGFGSRQYALRCFFWGDDHDRDATVFEEALLRPGVGRLQHPLYGTFDVVPFGRVSRRDDLLTAANQSIVEVTFWTTTGVVYPTPERQPRNELELAIEAYGEAQPADFADKVQIFNETIDSQKQRGTVLDAVGKADQYLSAPAQVTEAVSREFRAWQQVINTGINTLVGNPVLLAQQLVNLLFAPARAAAGIQNRLVAYQSFIQEIWGTRAARPEDQVCACSNPQRQTSIANDWFISDLNVQAALVAMCLSTLEHTFSTKPEALSAAEVILDQFAAVAAWREAGYNTLALPGYGARIQALDTGEAWQRTTEVVTFCAGYLVQISFTVATEEEVTLDRERTILDFAAEFYRGTDDYLDFIIDSNNLTGAEILELGRGTKIVWYPQ